MPELVPAAPLTPEPDPLHPAQRVYALAVAAAGLKYQAAVKAAREIRDREVQEALDTCWQVLEMEAKRA